MARDIGIDATCACAEPPCTLRQGHRRELQGTHLQLGIRSSPKYGESEAVAWAMARTIWISTGRRSSRLIRPGRRCHLAARPGARRDILECRQAIDTKLEEIADSFKGVSKAFALQPAARSIHGGKRTHL